MKIRTAIKQTLFLYKSELLNLLSLQLYNTRTMFRILTLCCVLTLMLVEANRGESFVYIFAFLWMCFCKISLGRLGIVCNSIYLFRGNSNEGPTSRFPHPPIP